MRPLVSRKEEPPLYSPSLSPSPSPSLSPSALRESPFPTTVKRWGDFGLGIDVIWWNSFDVLVGSWRNQRFSMAKFARKFFPRGWISIRREYSELDEVLFSGSLLPFKAANLAASSRERRKRCDHFGGPMDVC
ncbi:hypothetical protein BV898_02924 [Hypsibius exemplaris]|uniref:Uncharacterized protein n=1 Tax=Hypsibius exemplaris TaxID=2072580 RepID=A0A1W0X7G1_HYPEX|nr:hypothetical protein BV898_02924 [Hypsibius exemplaris]